MTAELGPGLAQLVNSAYPPARQALADSLAALERWLFVWQTLLTLALIVAFMWSGWARRLRDGIVRFSRPIARWKFLVGFVFAAIATIGFAVLTSPLDYYASFHIPHVFGLTRESLGQWLRDWAVGLALSAIVTALGAGLFVSAAARWSRRWPLAAGAAALPLVLIAFAILPVLIAPLFNEYRLLPPSALNSEILALARSQGINADRVYVYDMSRQTLEANAYVSGIGSVERIAVGDTLLRELRPDEVLYVVAHEMGHYKLGHLWIGAGFTWLGALVILAALYYAARWRRVDLGDAASLAFVALVITIVQLLMTPIGNGISRQIEHAADVFAARHTRLGSAGPRAFARLASYDLSPLHPPPLVVWYFYTHPPTDERISFAAQAAGIEHPQR